MLAQALLRLVMNTPCCGERLSPLVKSEGSSLNTPSRPFIFERRMNVGLLGNERAVCFQRREMQIVSSFTFFFRILCARLRTRTMWSH